MNGEPAQSVSKRGRVGEGRPTKRTPELVAKIADAIAIGLTDEEAGLLVGINPDTMTEWRKNPEFSGAIKRATAERLLMRLERIEAGEQGWQGTAWALERLYPLVKPQEDLCQRGPYRFCCAEGIMGVKRMLRTSRQDHRSKLNADLEDRDS